MGVEQEKVPHQAFGQTSRSADLEKFWQRAPADLLAALASSQDGLSAEEAARRLAIHGPNVVAEETRKHVVARIARKLLEPLIAIFIVAATISGFLGDWASAVTIVMILAISIVLEAIQEHRAEISAEALKKSVAIRSETLRGGKLVEVSAETIVPGDIVELKTGDLVPADGAVLESRSLQVNEALLTGESFPVEKRPGPSEAATPADAFNAIFGGTSVVNGTGFMLVAATEALPRP